MKIWTGTDVFEHMASLDGRVLFMHGCNAQGYMGAGVAKVVRVRYPEVYRRYRQWIDRYGKGRLMGLIQVVADPATGHVVVNAVTQDHVGWHDSPPARVEWIVACVNEVEKIPPVFDHYVTVAVGCGLGGLRWEEVAPVFEASSIDWQVCTLGREP